MNANITSPSLTADEQRLVAEVTAALTDPNLRTDQAMRLHQEIHDLLRRTHDDLYGDGGADKHEHRLAVHGHELPKVLEVVLVDSNLHTDQRMRLHRALEEALRRTADDRSR